MNSASTAFSLVSPFGTIDSRARPSGASHSRTRTSGGRLSSATGWGWTIARLGEQLSAGRDQHRGRPGAQRRPA